MFLSDLFHDIIHEPGHEGSLYKARFQENKSCLISSTSAPTVNGVVFALFYCCHCAVFSEWPDRVLSTYFAIYCDLSALFEHHKLALMFCFSLGVVCKVWVSVFYAASLWQQAEDVRRKTSTETARHFTKS